MMLKKLKPNLFFSHREFFLKKKIPSKTQNNSVENNYFSTYAIIDW